MDKNSLRKSLIEKLGISSSKKEFAFDVFLKKINQTLEVNEAFNLPGIGYFQLKNEPLLKEERKVSRGNKKLTKRTIFFLPSESSNINETSLFLSFDVDDSQKNFSEFDESIFDLGIEKPIVPIFEDDESLDSLQKSLESKIDELIANSEKLIDFNLFDNYLNQLSEETDIDDEIISEIQNENLHYIPDENIENTENIGPNFDAEEIDNIKIPDSLVDESQFNETEIETEIEKEANPFDELDDINFDDEETALEISNEKDGEDLSKEINHSPSDEIEIIPDANEKAPNNENKKEIRKSALLSIEELVENDDDLIDSVLPMSETDDEQIELEDENEESIEWDWGDELKAEFQEEVDEVNPVSAEDENNNIIPDEDDFQNLSDDLIDETENEIIDTKIEDEYDGKAELIEELKEITEDSFNDDVDLPENSDIANDKENLEEELDEEKLEEESTSVKKAKKRPSYRNYDWNGQGYGKGFWALLISFVFVTVFGLSYLLFWSKSNHNDNLINEQAIDTTAAFLTNSDSVLTNIDSSIVINTEPIKVETVEDPPEEKTLYRKIVSETRAKSRIYYDGKRYMLQVSSFKTSNRAEVDAMKYQSFGFDAFIVEANLPDLGGKWYRVRIGYFQSVEEVEEFVKKNNL